MSIWRWILSLFGRKTKPSPPPVVTLSGGPTIAIINATSVLTDTEIAPVVQALQVQVSRDFAPIWGAPATLVQIPKGGTPPKGSWWMVVMDNSDQQGALGYHYDTTPEDLPIGKVFAATCMDYNDPWSTCLSHELLEALGDPYINKLASDNNGTNYAYENCDAVESQTYLINNVAVSDFVTPDWFDPNAPAGRRLNYLNNVKTPFQLLPGGYIGVQDPNNGAGWGIITADRNLATLAGSRAPVGSRRDRRRTPRDLWVKY